MAYFAVCIFLSAFLLFQIQPMIARYILPWFGGTPAVWSTVMLFFQVLLTGGYAYSNWLIGSRKRREVVARERIGILTARYATMTSKSRVSRECEESLGLVESTSADVVRVVVEGVARTRPTPANDALSRRAGSDVSDLTKVVRP